MTSNTVWYAITQALKCNGVTQVFGLPSDDLALMIEIKKNNIDFLITKDQRNAMFMATGYSLAMNQLGVCVVGKGPAMMNCMTGVLEADAQCAPVLIIATSTKTEKYGFNRSFQEANQYEVVAPLAKWAHRVESADSIHWVMKKAIFLATSGSPGPVYIEIPEDIGFQQMQKNEVSSYIPTVHSKLSADVENINKARRMIKESTKPIIIYGGGTKRGRDRHLLKAFAEWLKAPIFVTASGRGAISEEDPLFCGLAGLYCPAHMMGLITQSDLFISVGSRLEETATFGWEASLRANKMIQINISEQGFNLLYDSFNLQGDAEEILSKLMETSIPREDSYQWIEFTENLKNHLFREKDAVTYHYNQLRVADILKVLNSYLPKEVIFVHENGLQDMWSYFYPYHALKAGQDAITPSEQTPLGFGAAAAVGVAQAQKEKMVVAIVGDGAFTLFQSDLSTVVQNKIPIIYVVLNNGGYGWLAYQNKNNGASSVFIHEEESALIGVHSNLHHLQVKSCHELVDSIKEAIAAYRVGKSVVLECFVQVKDVASALKDIYGDFPLKER
ncbi:thiamine pyrophosphate-binding protein [Cytobacillus kochii]|uniref:thiamine pyrophosphate-binding protein n=1 Tax=Cytobacillus kochii TaxID=859143 RepID=UPI00247FE9E6|nr:thiamine pyrophosphate-binding protein [Cytobacillus kochii]